MGCPLYSINGIALDDPARGWTVTDSSEWVAGLSIARPSLTAPGVDGSLVMPGSVETPAISLVVSVPRSTLDDLRALLLQPQLNLGRAGTPGAVYAELASLVPVRESIGDSPDFSAKVVLKLPGVWFRGDVETSPSAALTADGQVVRVFQGISGRITDALVRVTDITNPMVADSAGSFMAYSGTVGPSQFLRMHAETGRAWLTGTDTWAGGTEVDPLLVSYGMGPNFFAINPSFTDPSDRAGSLTVTASARGAGAALAVQGRNAYLV